MRTKKTNILFVFGVLLSIAAYSLVILESCSAGKKDKRAASIINTTHLDHLYEEIRMGEDSVGIIHIYSEYPDYDFVGDEDEGIACVDDVSRASIFYLRQFQLTHKQEYLNKGIKLLRFLTRMQADNGYFYNFIWPDGSINTDGNTSRAEPSWWSWRTFWAYGVAIDVLQDYPGELLDTILEQRRHLIRNILSEPDFMRRDADTVMGFHIPTWLPGGSAADQAALVLMGMAYGVQEFPSEEMKQFIHHFADGIMMMRVEEKDSLQDGAFFSWENLWHAYGNSQSYALLRCGKILNDTLMRHTAWYEIEHFYPTLLQQGGLEHFWIKSNGVTSTAYDVGAFSQIAYGRRPMIWAALEAYDQSGGTNKRYLDLAINLGQWFFGDNPASRDMYDISTGRGFDGITSSTEINQNAGAESTIESLLSLQALEIHGVYYDPEHHALKHP